MPIARRCTACLASTACRPVLAPLETCLPRRCTPAVLRTLLSSAQRSSPADVARETPDEPPPESQVENEVHDGPRITWHAHTPPQRVRPRGEAQSLHDQKKFRRSWQSKRPPLKQRDPTRSGTQEDKWKHRDSFHDRVHKLRPCLTGYPGEAHSLADQYMVSTFGRPGPQSARNVAKPSETAPPDLPVLEYKGDCLMTLHHRQGVEKEWLDQGRWWSDTSSSPLTRDGLASEAVNAFHKWTVPNAEEKKAREAIMREIGEFVRRVLPGRRVELFGSERTGLATVMSDLDIRLCPPNERLTAEGTQLQMAPRRATRDANQAALQKLQWFIQRKKAGYTLCALRHARYPLLSMHHQPSGTDIQIVCNNDTSQTRKYISQYLESFPTLHSTYSIARAILDARGLLDVYHGGLGSYSLFMMIVASYKLNKNADLHDPWSALKHFMSFWATFDTYKHGVSIEPPGLFERYSDPARLPNHGALVAPDDPVQLAQQQLGLVNPMQPYVLALQDPADPFNDLGRKVYAIKHVQALLENKFTFNHRKSTPGAVHEIVKGCVYPISRRKIKLAEYSKTLAVGTKDADTEAADTEAADTEPAQAEAANNEAKAT